VDRAELVSALRHPEFYDPPVERVEYLQTHISSVFLTGTRAYKLKKPVNFGFLDFSTLELRERYCRQEVELNRRLTEDVYLGVRPITNDSDRLRLGGTGPVVDWLVEMNQLDGGSLGVEKARRRELTRSHMNQLVERLVPFYREARRGPEVERHASIEALRRNTDENFAQTESVVGKLIARARWQEIRAWTDDWHGKRPEIFAARVAAGRICEGHGDLHLGNIFFGESPVIFDCIEFNERLRCGDPASDLAFLVMDLEHRELPHLGAYLITRYVEESGDDGIAGVLDYYKCYRAFVRGKIAAFTAADPAIDASERRRQRNRARRYFGQAYRYTGGTHRPPLVVVHGLMGTGKTAIASFLRERFGWHVLSTDVVRKQIAGIGEHTRVFVPYGSGLYSSEMNHETYAEIGRRAENLLQAGFPVVVDGSFKRRESRRPLVDLAHRVGAHPLLMETVCGRGEQRRRLEARRLYDTRSDGRVELADRQRHEFESPGPEHDAFSIALRTDGTMFTMQERAVAALREQGLLEIGGGLQRLSVAAS